MRSERGFTLLEVLVAFIIAALALGVLFQGALGGLQSVRVAGHYEEALSRARSHLATLDRGGALVAGERTGDDGSGFHWRIRIAPLATAAVAAAAAPALPGAVASGAASAPDAAGPSAARAALYAVRVTVSWTSDGGAREVVLDSERVGPAPPRAP